MTVRTQVEIAARIGSLDASGEDWLGFGREVLLPALDFEHAKPWLKEDATPEQWQEARAPDVAVAARSYLDFAIGKMRDHRGISASRSVVKLTEYAWLLGRDDVVAAMDAAEYANYGAPKVKAFAIGMGWSWPEDAALSRMADGLPCSDECCEGCAQ